MTIIDRIKANTPNFFKRVQVIAGAISTISITAQTSLSQYLPAYAITFLQHCAVSGIVAIVLAQLTKTDTKETL